MVLGQRNVTSGETAAVAYLLHGRCGPTTIIGSCCVCRDQRKKQRKNRKSCVICMQPVCNELSVSKTTCFSCENE